ncbi:zinc ribbon domain-containing protein [Shewanella sp. 10N.261.52.F9]
MQHDKWACPKCNQREFETGEIRVSGGFWSRIFDMQNKR